MTAYVARVTIGASRSVLMAMIAFAERAADDVLDRPADPARDVQVRCDARPGLADLLGVWSPAGRGHDARDADRAAEQRRELVELGEALRTPDAAPATDDDPRVGERDRPGPRPARGR